MLIAQKRVIARHRNVTSLPLMHIGRSRDWCPDYTPLFASTNLDGRMQNEELRRSEGLEMQRTVVLARR